MEKFDSQWNGYTPYFKEWKHSILNGNIPFLKEWGRIKKIHFDIYTILKRIEIFHFLQRMVIFDSLKHSNFSLECFILRRILEFDSFTEMKIFDSRKVGNTSLLFKNVYIPLYCILSIMEILLSMNNAPILKELTGV